ncbi:uncharacterized protein KGF55_003825 [Candida pseudojiufengensis]|uniref:uncharacterized protein n=1 Tax=Candida pseudojiufengensis TaxID=497109 RepID=UPI0022243670|nr:uncharacterized protein KGF55_003825 [Candida pseudojiufengensis]KAI5961854.1 hypothetical protein KGF55_003825 [Candida pseudojiufengensis]
MGSFGYNNNSIEGDLYVQRLSSYIKKNEESLANGLLCFSKNKVAIHKIKPLRLTFTIHHLYYLTERIESSNLGIDVGPLNIKLDNPNHEPTFISFMANNARSSRIIESDSISLKSIKSINSMVSIWSKNFSNIKREPKLIKKDLKYLYSSFTKIPCLILTPKTKINSIQSYEEYPCDTSVPIKIFKNLQVLEIIEYEPNEIFGWNLLSDQLRILIIRKSKINDMSEIIYDLVVDDENGRSSFNSNTRKQQQFDESTLTHDSNDIFRNKRERGNTNASNGAGSIEKQQSNENSSSSEAKWSVLKQLTISETSITHVTKNVLKPLHNLVKLNLSNNLLQNLPEGLDQLVNIKYLNFSDNYITDLKNLPSNLKHLLTLNLNNNKIINLNGLEKLISLEKIDLRRNQITELSDCKSLVLLYQNVKNFDNVYISQNSLPKNYRVDLFNLFNGVKYKNNNIKIDDSKPGYFEKAMLLDQESALKNLNQFLGAEIVDDNTKLKLQLQEIQQKFSNSNDKDKDDETIATLNTLVPSSPKINELDNGIKDLKIDTSKPPTSPSPSVVPNRSITTNSASTSVQTSPQQQQQPNNRKLKNLSHTALQYLSQPSSPLHNNQNMLNKIIETSPYSTTTSIHDNNSKNTIITTTTTSPKITSSPSHHLTNKMLHLNSSNSSIPSSLKSMKKSTSTFIDLEKDNTNDTNSNPNNSNSLAAPNIVTPLQVTARMST